MNIGVVGCGLAGATVALALHRKGHRVEIFERSPVLGSLGAGILLQEPAFEVFRQLEVLSDALRIGEPITRLAGFTPRGAQVLDLPYHCVGNDAHGLGIHRGVLFTLLKERVEAAGVPIHPATTIAAVESDGDGARILFEDGRPERRFDFVVLADGAHARTASGSWRRWHRTCGPWGAWWTSMVSPAVILDGTLHQVFDGPRRLLGILPTGELPGGGRGFSLFWGTYMADAEAWRARGLTACLHDILSLEPRLAPLLGNIPPPESWVLARYFDHMPRHFHDGKSVAVIGDGAHAMGPHLGQGANLAIQDAWSLAESIGPWRDLGGWGRTRRKHAAIYHRFSRFAGPFFQSHSRPLAWFRDRFMPLACRLPWAQRRMVRVLRGGIRKVTDLF